jgi:hypothetical protein
MGFLSYFHQFPGGREDGLISLGLPKLDVERAIGKFILNQSCLPPRILWNTHIPSLNPLHTKISGGEPLVSFLLRETASPPSLMLSLGQFPQTGSQDLRVANPRRLRKKHAHDKIIVG